MSILKKIWFWTLITGIILGLYLGYQIGTISGYERAIRMIEVMMN